MSGRSSSVLVDGITRRYGSSTVLHGVSLEVEANSFYSLLGPSGCGKTTLLRIMAGLDRPDAGRIVIGGVDHTLTPAHRRPTNLVFQSGALFPHMTVAENVAFGLKSERVKGAEAKRRVGEMLELVAMDGFAGRSTATLSGGQRQRVAIARSLVKRPDVLLLDEPLSALDLSLQLHMRRELRRWQQETETTFVCVTHNQAEAMEMADTIAVMRAGRLEQSATAQELYARPSSLFVAEFIGENNVFTGLTRTSGSIEADGIVFAGFARADMEALAVRPENVRLVGVESGESRGRARVTTVGFTGRTLRFGLETSTGRELLAETALGDGLRVGDEVGVAFADSDVVRIPSDPEQQRGTAA